MQFKQEVQEDFEQLSEDRKRLLIRNDLKENNKHLVYAAKDAGVETNLEYAIFQNHGYMGLYGGLTAQGIHEKKGLKTSQKILDHMIIYINLYRSICYVHLV